MFIDEVSLKFIAGKGGDGAVSWRREKCIPNGGPYGWSGWKGGDIILQASPHESTLSDFRHLTTIRAQDGERGGTKEMTGAGGEDRIVLVPVGTQVRLKETNEIICDLVRTGQTFLLCRGGRGGYGNAHFTAAVRQAPSFAELWDVGEQKTVIMELKLVADVGIVGLPNAGKSTFISQVTNVRPKIADYPFTTLIPNLGVMDHKGESLVLEDAPWLIEWASEGKWLGLQFLKHLDRTRFLLHLVDISFGADEAYKNYHLIRREIEKYSPDMAEKTEYLVFSKLDTLTPEDRSNEESRLQELFGDREFLVFSSLSHENLDILRDRLLELYHSLPSTLGEEAQEWDDLNETVFDFKKIETDPNTAKLIHESPGIFRVKGERIEQIARMTPMSNREAIERIWDILDKIHILSKIETRLQEDLSINPDDVKIYIWEQVFNYEQVRFRKSFRR